MKELETLLNRRWILKSEDRELYYKIRDSIGEIRKFATEKMGCQVIENALLVKMEKIPALPETCMGIDAFAWRTGMRRSSLSCLSSPSISRQICRERAWTGHCIQAGGGW